jgi:hypothetical protein
MIPVVIIFIEGQQLGEQHLVDLGQHDPQHRGAGHARRERDDRLDQIPVKTGQRRWRRHLLIGAGREDHSFDQSHQRLEFEEVHRVVGNRAHQQQATEVAQRGDDHVGDVQPCMLFKALNSAFIER